MESGAASVVELAPAPTAAPWSPLGGADEVLAQLLRIEPVLLRDLRDHLVAAVVAVEAGDVVAAEQRVQRGADVGDLDAQRRRVVAVDRRCAARGVSKDMEF